MNSGFYSSFAAFAARSDALEVIGNNIANASTVGFKSQHSFYRPLADSAAPSTPMNQAINSFGVSVALSPISPPGTLQPTAMKPISPRGQRVLQHSN